MLAILMSQNTGKSNLLKCKQLYCLEKPETDVNSYIFRKWRRKLTVLILKSNNNYDVQDYWRQMLARMLAINVSNYHFQKCWRQMLSITFIRNAGDICEQLEFS